MAVPTIAPSPPPYPPIRYSPIQEAFRGALDVGLSELFRLPFEKAAARREQEKTLSIYGGERQIDIANIPRQALADVQSKVKTGVYVPEEQIDPTTRSFFPHANVAPAAEIGGKKYYSQEALGNARHYAQPVLPGMQNYIDDVRKRLGVEDRSPVLTGELPQIAQGLGIQKEAAQYQQGVVQFEEMRTDDLIRSLQLPPPGFEDMVQHMAFRDPQTGQISRNVTKLFYALNVPRYISALQNPALARDPASKLMIEGFLKEGQEMLPRLVPTTTYFPTREEVQANLSEVLKASPSESLTGMAGRLAIVAGRMHLLTDPATGNLIVPTGPQDMVKAITALKSDTQLAEAMIYWEAYGSMDKLKNAQNGGLGAVPTNVQTWKYLRQAFARGDPWAQPADSGLRQPIDTGEGPAAAEYQPPTATTPGKTSLTPVGTETVLGSKQPTAAVPPVQFVGTNAERAVYNHVFIRMKTDPTSFRAMSDSLEGAFRGAPSDILNYFRKLSSDQTVNMSPTERKELTDGLAALEALPPQQQKRWLEELKWKARSVALQGREDALVGAEAAAAEKPAEGGKEKKPAEKKKE